MESFEFARPTTLKEAVSLLAPRWDETEILAGGTDLLGRLKDYLAAPTRVVSLRGVAELEGIHASTQGLRIGALVTLEELLRHRGIREGFPAVAQAAEGITSPQMRNMGTVGGDLLQRPRCWYYRTGFGLLARDDKGQALVPRGDNRYHAIFGNEGPAYFVCPSSLAPPLIALGAKVRMVGPQGARTLALAELYVTPKSAQEREHTLAPNEILTAVEIPPSARSWRSATYEVRQRELMDWPLATASVALKLESGRVAAARIVMGHVAPTPWAARAAEKSLGGKPVNDESAAQAAELAVSDARPLSRNRYKVQLARVAVKRALLACAQQPQGGDGQPHAAATRGGS